MGSGGAKKTNKMLAEETRRAQELQDVAGGRSAEIYGAGRGDIDWGRKALMDMYSGMGETGAGGEGGGGPAFNPMEWESTVEPFYRGVMQSEHGIYTPEQIATMQSAGARPIQSAFEGLSRRLASERAGRGLGYGSGTSALMRDQAYAMGEMGKQSASDIAKMVAESRMGGAAGLTPVESEKRAFKVSERDKALAAARARAAAGKAGAETEFGQRRALIHDILGLEGDRDLAYMDRQLAGQAGGRESIGMRVDETPMWQKLGGELLKGGAGAALGAFTGGLAPMAMGALGGLGKAAAKQGGLGALQYNPVARNPF